MKFPQICAAVSKAALIILAVASVVGLLALLGWVVCNWETLTEGETGTASLRNMALVFGGPVAMALAVWRSIVAQRQAATAQRQVELSEGDSLDRQFQSAIEMLGHESLIVRFGGVHCLHLLSQKHLETHGGEVRDVLTLFSKVNEPSDNNNTSGDKKAPTVTALDGRFTGPVEYVTAAACAKLLDDELKARGLE